MDETIANFQRWFTEIAVNWNNCERAGQKLLATILGNSPVAHAMCCEMGNVQLVNALNIAADLESEGTAKAIRRFCESFERLRAYRNFVIHGLIEIPRKDHHMGHGVTTLFTESGKGSFKIGTQNVLDGDLRAVAEWLGAFTLLAEGTALAIQNDEPSPSLDKFPLPARMAKNSRNHPLLERPPQSSPA
ncbi:hypothetical protein RXV95_00430 [Novosphingobium sp. ZN18A2]|uniref:hypothetical protein n=1 Tax=Novosphingobium sp. ZN18A2 TaxID=3079861 RepID=UPI0030D626D3